MNKVTKKSWEADVLRYLESRRKDHKATALLEEFNELEKIRIQKAENRKKINARNKIAGTEKVKVIKSDYEKAKELLAEGMLLLK